MRKRATAKEVAEAAGVSKWTVIRAFKPGASIADDAKKRILDAAERLNYSPNLLARSLSTNVTNQIAVFVDDFANPQKLPFLEVLTERLQAEGLVAVLVNINNHFDHVHAVLNADQRQVDAIVLLGTAFRDETLNDRRLGPGMPPMFVLARDSQIEGVPAVVCDSELGLREVVGHLHERGYRRPGFMTGASALSTALKRRHFFEQFWAERGVTEIVDLSADRYSFADGSHSVRQYLKNTPADERIDVLMCENDILALGALETIRGEFGLSVPKDIAVVGFDNYELGQAPSFGLTTYEQPRREMAEAIVGMIKGEIARETIQLPGRLVVRTST